MSVKEELRRCVIDDMIRKVTSKRNNVVLVLDTYTAKIVSSACRMYDVMDSGVLVLENLTVKRQRLSMPAIYFLEPSSRSIDLLLGDFSDAKNPQYPEVHLFFTFRVESSLVDRLAQNEALSHRISTFLELNCDFVALESRVFTLNRPLSLSRLLRASTVEVELAQISRQLVSVMLTLSEYPYIRFSASPRSHKLANLFHDIFGQMLQKLQSWKPASERGTLLLLDRDFDLLTPATHSIGYQSFLQDVLPTDGELVDAPQEAEQFVLSDDDSLWVEFRHKHIAYVLQQVVERFKQFQEKNAAAQWQRRDKNQQVTTKDMSKAMEDMPKYQFIIRQYKKHLSLTEACMARFDEGRYEQVLNLEEDMAVGLTEDGSDVKRKELLERLQVMCRSPDISQANKVRLIMVYMLTAEKELEVDARRMLLESANVPPHSDLARALVTLRSLMTQYNTGCMVKNMSKSERQQLQKELRDARLQHMRYKPKLAGVLQEMLDDTLSRERFPYVQEPPPRDTLEPPSSSVFAASARKKGSTTPNWRAEEKKQEKAAGPRHIVFVLGGVCFSETAVAYDMARQRGANIIIGSSETFGGDQFIANLAGAED